MSGSPITFDAVMRTYGDPDVDLFDDTARMRFFAA